MPRKLHFDVWLILTELSFGSELMLLRFFQFSQFVSVRRREKNLPRTEQPRRKLNLPLPLISVEFFIASAREKEAKKKFINICRVDRCADSDSDNFSLFYGDLNHLGTLNHFFSVFFNFSLFCFIQRFYSRRARKKLFNFTGKWSTH